MGSIAEMRVKMLRFLKENQVEIVSWCSMAVFLGTIWLTAWYFDNYKRNACLEKGYEAVVAHKCAHVTFEGQ
jgi:hypothetical protein